MTTPKVIPDNLTEVQRIAWAEKLAGIYIDDIEPEDEVGLAVSDVDAHLRRTKSGKVVPVVAHKREYDPVAWAEALLPDQKEAVLTYASSSYRVMNAFLRGGGPAMVVQMERDEGYKPTVNRTQENIKYMEGQVELMDAAFESAPPTPAKRTVHRGLVMPPFADPQVGDEIESPGFSSTSGDKAIAEKYASWKADDLGASRAAVAEIEVPKGSKVVDVQAVWQVHGQGLLEEQEILLNRDATFIVTSVEGGGDEPWRLGLRLK